VDKLMPICTTCGIDKADDDFPIRNGKIRRRQCRECRYTSQKSWTKANLDRRHETVHRHYAKKAGKHPDECRKVILTEEERRASEKASKRRDYENNRDRYKTRAKASAARRSDQLIVSQREYRLAHRERAAILQKAWRQANAGKILRYADKRSRTKRVAQPPWLTPIHLAEIQAFYNIAQAATMQSGIVYHVDHIHPLQGKNFNGLHVPWNLQVIPAWANQRKHRRLEAHVRCPS
jgi:hypothetical protein